MSEPRFTQHPTPWSYEVHELSTGYSAIDKNGRRIGGLDHLDKETARLIAAAPDLYSALSAASGYLLNAEIDLETGASKQTAINTIKGGLKVVRAALAKTREEAPMTKPKSRLDIGRRVWTCCQADDDGFCDWMNCPQLRDGEPAATGRHCPHDRGRYSMTEPTQTLTQAAAATLTCRCSAGYKYPCQNDCSLLCKRLRDGDWQKDGSRETP